MKRLVGGVRMVWARAITNQWAVSLFGFIVVGAASVFLLQAQPALAAPATSVNWLNRQYIVDNNGHNYYDSNTFDFVREYVEETAENCPDSVRYTPAHTRNDEGLSDDFFFFHAVDYDKPEFYTSQLIVREPFTTDSGSIGCNETAKTMTVGNASNRRITWYKNDKDQVVNMFTGIVFSRKGDFKGSPKYYRDSEVADPKNNCRDLIVLHAANPISAAESMFGRGDIAGSSILYSVEANSDLGRESESYDLITEPNAIGPKTCHIRGSALDRKMTGEFAEFANGHNSYDLTFTTAGLDSSGATAPNDGDYKDDAFIIFVGDMNNLPKDATGTPTTTPTDPGSSDPDKLGGPTCKGGGLGWIICPIISAIQVATDRLQDALQYFLSVNPLPVGTGPIYESWNNIRNISNIAFVIAFFAIILSQATSIGISNYGIKRLLPRLIAIVIATNVSYYICSFAIDIFNILGVGIASLFTLVGGEAGSTIVVRGGEGALMTGAIVVALTWAITTGAIVEIFPFLVAAFMALLMTFLVLIARQALLILLVVFSPLAFVAGLLPGTQQWLNRWSGMFIGMLAMYPIVMALFAAGELATAILSQTGG